MDEIFKDKHQHLSILPINQRKWVPEHDIAHFILEAARLIPKDRFQIVKSPSIERYNPQILLALLVFGYVNDIYSSSRIELLALRDIRFRYVSQYSQPNSDAIYGFRQNNIEAFKDSFLAILMVANQLNIPVIGNLPIEDIRIKASASTKGGKGSSVNMMLAEEFRILIDDMVEEAERVDSEGGFDIGQQDLPSELMDERNLKSQLTAAFNTFENKTVA